MEGLEGLSRRYGEDKDKTSSGVASWVLRSPATGRLLGKNPEEKMSANDALKRVEEASKIFEKQALSFQARFEIIELRNKERIDAIAKSFEERIKTAKEEAKKEALLELREEISRVKNESKNNLDGLRDRFREELEDVKEKGKYPLCHQLWWLLGCKHWLKCAFLVVYPFCHQL